MRILFLDALLFRLRRCCASALSRVAFRSPTRNKPRIKIGQIGVGHAHATKLQVYRESPDYEVVGIVEPNKELRERAKRAAGVSRRAV